MEIHQEPRQSGDSQHANPARISTLQAVSRYRIEELRRSKRRIISLIFVGLLISVLVHLNLGFFLSLLTRGSGSSTPSGAFTAIEFAIEDSESLTDLPESQFELAPDAGQTEASFETRDATQVTLVAKQVSTPLQAANGASTPSLSGRGSAGFGAGIGASGGGGTSFFGISSKGTRICYIVDVSGSMRNNGRLEAAFVELTKSLKKLPDFTQFFLLFYSSGYQEPAIQRGWNTARASTVRRMVREFKQIRASGGTEPKLSFEKAFTLKPLPEVIYFMTDGEIARFSIEDLQNMLPTNHRVVIHTVAFGSNSSQQLLRKIAKLTGGKFTFVPTGSTP